MTDDAAFEPASHVLHGLVITSIVFIILDTFFLALRSISRCLVKKVSVGYDDLLLWSAYVVNIGLCAVGLVVANIEGSPNLSADDSFRSPGDLQRYLQPLLKCLFALGPLFAFGYTLPKLSLLLFYLRVFVGKISIAIYVFIAVVIVEMIAFLVSAILYCQPVAFYWQRTGSGHCFDADTFYRVTSGLKCLLDLFLVVLPLQPLWKLQVPKLRKIGLAVVFLTSIIGVVGGIVRFAYLIAYTVADLTPRTSARLVSVVILEPNLFFVAACLPACSSLVMEALHRPNIRKFFKISTIQTPKRMPYVSYGEHQASGQAGRASEDFERLVEGRLGDPKCGDSPYEVENGVRQSSIPLREM